VKSIIETLEGNKVKLSVEIDEVEFDRNIDKAFRKIANEIRIPGFRQGKAPRQLLQAQIGLALRGHKRFKIPSQSIWHKQYASMMLT